MDVRRFADVDWDKMEREAYVSTSPPPTPLTEEDWERIERDIYESYHAIEAQPDASAGDE
jgi:hypothetical protein